ncbi:uncharacterized protein LOC132168170 [Corylus avellana]|uniref:uncharacterized protein LOC132168170 n=1 Tax=Corylus avellana TaxID=13451 RepID=UPI00286C7234|nr:uncharacterized protein LOC132168170 [Corylus avellana]XP_059435266.1 uncharacterized protein LOC132168170 [Corylus avellana]
MEKKLGLMLKANLTRLAAATAPIPDESINMQAILHDVFGMHKVREDHCDPQMETQADAVVHKEVDEDSARKFYNLLKREEKPLHDKTNHSKLSATVYLYNLKCAGGLSNTIITSLLDFINQLLPTDDEALPNSTYEAKRFLRDMVSVGTTNVCAVPDTKSPVRVRARSSVASRPGDIQVDFEGEDACTEEGEPMRQSVFTYLLWIITS